MCVRARACAGRWGGPAALCPRVWECEGAPPSPLLLCVFVQTAPLSPCSPHSWGTLGSAVLEQSSRAWARLCALEAETLRGRVRVGSPRGKGRTANPFCRYPASSVLLGGLICQLGILTASFCGSQEA